ncbi:PAS domain-containing protein [Ekhidna sp.]|uniref:hybrid sensor histidine kinase/response regulator n=1 Tax=Ekhidna sp. TaxID=2608089 RepID=UPI0032975E6B
MTTWKENINILHLEDNPDDVDLLKIVLGKSKLKHSLKIALTKKEFLSEDLSKYDLIICDYNLKDYDGLTAIKYVRSHDPIKPVILLSGTVGEELAADLLKAGASDFVLKSNLKKIAIAIERTMHEASVKWEKQRFQREVVEKNLILDTLFDSFMDMIFLKDVDGRYVKVNRAFSEFLKLHEGEIIGGTEYELFPDEIASEAIKNDEFVKLSGKPVLYDLELNHEGRRLVMEISKTPLLEEGKVTGIVGTCRDVTSKKILLEETIKAKSILSQAEKLTLSGSFEYDADLDLINCSSNFKQILKLRIEGDTISFRKFAQMIKEEDRHIFDEGINKSIDNYEEYHNEHRFLIKSKDKLEIKYIKLVLRPDYKDEKGVRFYGTLVDVTAEHENQIYLMNKQEQEREELARELHDNLGQKMNAISMYISKIYDDMPENKDLEKVKNLSHETIDDLGYLINNISVKQIEEHSLDYAIDKLLTYVPASFTMDKKYEYNEEDLSPFVKAQVYRVIQEALNNAIKYSEATEVSMHLKQEGGILSLLIKDNGKGFVVEEVLNGNGLQNITHRVRRSNGLINIDSKKGQGTRLEVKMPIS